MTELAALILKDAIRSITAKSESNMSDKVRSTQDRKNRRQTQSRNLEKTMKAMKKQHIAILIEKLEFLVSLPRAPIEYIGIEESWPAVTLELQQRIAWLRSEMISKSG